MTIEIIHRPAQGNARPVRLLFVHGISVGAWIWDLHFLAHFAELGYDCTAISLRGHGKSAGRGQVREFSLGDFSADVAWASRTMGAPHVIIGHSLGGAVVQNFIMRGGTPAGVALMMSVPPHGLLPSSISMYATNPGLWTELRRSVAGSAREADLGVIERNMFLNGAPATAGRLRDLMTEPAERASRDVMGMIPFAPMPWAMPKLLVMGGTQDRFIPASDAHLTAMYYGTRAIILNAAHAVMADFNWRVAADALAYWLDECFCE